MYLMECLKQLPEHVLLGSPNWCIRCALFRDMVVLGHNRMRGLPTAEQIVWATQKMWLAEKLQRPLVVLFDSIGCDPFSVGIEQAVSRSMFVLAQITVQKIGVIVGNAFSGAAAAWGFGALDVMASLEQGVAGVAIPAIASRILRCDENDVPAQTAKDLLRLGFVSTILHDEDVSGWIHDAVFSASTQSRHTNVQKSFVHEKGKA